MKLQHTYVPDVYQHISSAKITDLDSFLAAVKTAGEELKASIPADTPDYENAAQTAYNEFVGGAFEVYTEFFFKLFGTNDSINVATIDDTSFDKYQDGLDFWTTTKNGEVGLVQSKFRSQHVQLTSGDLEAFRDRVLDTEISKKNAIIFTSRIVTEHDPLFKFNPNRPSWHTSIAKMCSVFDAVKQHNMISLHDDVNTTPFFQLFFDAVKTSNDAQRMRADMPTHYPHQLRMYEAGQKLLQGDVDRGTIICATGGGKTNVEWNLIRDIHMNNLGTNKTITILVAPSLALCGQHFDVFAGLNAGDNKSIFDHGVHAINFHTGGTPQYDGPEGSLTRGTNSATTIAALDTHLNVHITVTYKSLARLVSILQEAEVEANLTICDEFHILVPNLPEAEVELYREQLIMFPSKKMLFFSACNKRSSYLSTDESAVFGDELIDIGVQELIEVGVLKRNYRVVVVRTSKLTNGQISRATGLRKSIAHTAKVAAGEVDEYQLYKETAFVLKAMEDAGPQAVGIAFARRVDRMRAMVDDAVFIDQLNKQGQTVVKQIDSKVHTRVRKNVFQSIKNANRGLLVQHSTVREGVDVPNLNCSFVMRMVSPITFQQGPFGRICRTTVADRTRLINGDITPAELNDTGTIYLLVDDSDEEQYAEHIMKFVRNIIYTGLDRDQWEMSEIGHKRYGVKPPGGPEDNTAEQMSEAAMNKLKEKVYLEIHDIERKLQLAKATAEAGDL